MASDAIQQQEARTEQAGQSVATRERRSRILYAIASFEGNRKFASSLSDQLMLTAYLLLH